MKDKAKEAEDLLNELISSAVSGNGHVYVVDRKNNKFALRLTEPIKISYFGGANNYGGE